MEPYRATFTPYASVQDALDDKGDSSRVFNLNGTWEFYKMSGSDWLYARTELVRNASFLESPFGRLRTGRDKPATTSEETFLKLHSSPIGV
jgi:hypothetical protein